MKVDYQKLKKYEEIIYKSRPVLPEHPPMDREKRAAQFSPFSALTGYAAAIQETQKRMEEKWEDEYEIENQEEKLPDGDFR